MTYGESIRGSGRVGTLVLAIAVALAIGMGALVAVRGSNGIVEPSGAQNEPALDAVSAPPAASPPASVPEELAFVDEDQPDGLPDDSTGFSLDLEVPEDTEGASLASTTTVTATTISPAPPAKSTAPGAVGAPASPTPTVPAGLDLSAPVGGGVSWAGLGDAADPFVVATSTGYFLYTTNTSAGHVPVWYSPDLTGATWQPAGDALPELPVWAAPSATQTWAPAVLWRNDGWVLYFTTRDAASGRQCIGVATSSSAGGPFVSEAPSPIVCQTALGGSIDPSTFVDRDGQAHLLFKNDGNCCRILTSIWSQPLSADGLSLVGSPSQLLWSSDSWEGALIEGPSMIQAGNRFHLIYSANSWASNRYAMGHAVCESVQGPCHKSSTSPWRASDGGPGGGEFLVAANGSTWLVFHEWRYRIGYPGGVRSMYLERLSIDGSPLPTTTTVPPTTLPSTTVPATTVPPTTVPATTLPPTTVPPTTVPPTTVPATTVSPTTVPPTTTLPPTTLPATCLLYTSPSPRDATLSRMPSSA